jgi:predicted nucleic-acid-binding Zn-ribbon protein
MKNSGLCPKCHGRDVVAASDIIDQVGDASTGLAQDAFICTACGYIEFYAKNLTELKELVRTHSRSVAPSPFR